MLQFYLDSAIFKILLTEIIEILKSNYLENDTRFQHIKKYFFVQESL